MNDWIPEMPKILVAEDEDQLREALVDLLQAQGYDVVAEVSTGTDAVSMSAELDPELVLIDYRMPGLDGIAATEAIKAHSPGTQIVMFTAYDEASLSLDATRAGVSAFLVKGSAPSLILQALSSALERRGRVPRP